DPRVGDPKGPHTIKTGYIDIRVKKGTRDEKYKDVVELIPDGGYVESTSIDGEKSSITIRVPQEFLDATLAKLRKLGTVQEESLETFDRSYESIDYEARLKIL